MASLNTRSKGQSTSFTLEDVSELIRKSEEKILDRLDDVLQKFSILETRMDAIQTEQIRIDMEMVKLKEVVVRQQEQIEKNENEKRQCNVVVSGIPEADIQVDGQHLTNDTKKAVFLSKIITDSFTEDDICSCTRLGRQARGQNRLLHIKFSNADVKNEILRNQRKIREIQNITKAFGMLYINKDMSILSRKEDKRLRDEMKSLRSSAAPNDKIYIRGGKLYHNASIVDKVDFGRQLF